MTVTHHPTLNTVANLEDGALVAVRTSRIKDKAKHRYVVSGTLEFADNRTEGWIATLRNPQAWRWEAGDPATTEAFPRVTYDAGPPKDVRRGFADDYHVNPGLHRADNDRVMLVAQDPVWGRSGVEYYYPQPLGRVDALRAGVLVDPTTLLVGEW